MLVAYVDRDYLELDCIGTQWTEQEIAGYMDDPPDEYPQEKTRFRCKDDDGIVYFGGWLLNDDWCTVQQTVLSWGMYDSGCTTIEVHVGDEWKQEIG